MLNDERAEFRTQIANSNSGLGLAKMYVDTFRRPVRWPEVHLDTFFHWGLPEAKLVIQIASKPEDSPKVADLAEPDRYKFDPEKKLLEITEKGLLVNLSDREVRVVDRLLGGKGKMVPTPELEKLTSPKPIQEVMNDLRHKAKDTSFKDSRGLTQFTIFPSHQGNGYSINIDHEKKSVRERGGRINDGMDERLGAYRRSLVVAYWNLSDVLSNTEDQTKGLGNWLDYIEIIRNKGLGVPENKAVTEQWKGYKLDKDGNNFHFNYKGRSVKLTPAEWGLMRLLFNAEGQTVPRVNFLEALGNKDLTDSRIIDVHILRIRGKLGPDSVIIETHRGVGYRLKPVK